MFTEFDLVELIKNVDLPDPGSPNVVALLYASTCCVVLVVLDQCSRLDDVLRYNCIIIDVFEATAEYFFFAGNFSDFRILIADTASSSSHDHHLGELKVTWA